MQVHNQNAGKWLLLFLQGTIIGSGAILPGISGGVLCVAFGLYGPMIGFFAHPVRSLRKNYRLFLPVFLGCGAGFLLLAQAVEYLLAVAAVGTTALFVGLIFGTLPGLFRSACAQSRDTSWTGFVISLALSYLFFQLLSGGTVSKIQPNWGWYLFSGSIWAFSMILPGLSSSSILIFLGLYQPMADGIGHLDFSVIFPLLIGFLLTLLFCARAVNRLMETLGPLIRRILLGFVISSALAILPTPALQNAESLIILLLCLLTGFLLAYCMDRQHTRG